VRDTSAPGPAYYSGVFVCKTFVFVHLPKTGGEFLREIVKAEMPEIVVPNSVAKHGSLDKLPEEYRHLPTFTRISHDLSADFDTTIRNFYVDPVLPPDAGAGWVDLIEQDIDLQTWHLHRQIGDRPDVVIGRQENLGGDFLKFLRDTGSPVTPGLKDRLLNAGRKNASKRSGYQTYYDAGLRDEIGRRAAEVIDRFGYTFE
jgi:hypothetical protein